MRFILSQILILLLSFLAQMVAPLWWIPAPIVLVWCITVGMQSASKSFFLGFSSISTLWVINSMFLSYQNDHLLLMKVTALFGLSSKYILICATAVLGGVLGGLSALVAFYIRKYFEKEKTHNFFG